MKRFLNVLLANRYVMGIVALLALGLALYQTFHVRHPQLTFEVLSNSPLLSVPEQIRDLEIRISGRPIDAKEEAIRLMVVRVINTGDRSIRNEDYDPRAPLGLRLNVGHLISISTLSATNDYLAQHQKPKKLSGNTAIFDPVFLEPGQFFDIRILAIARPSDVPNVMPIGTVLDAGTPTVVETYRAIPDEGFLSRTFGGGPFIQILRIVFYFVVGAVVFLTSAFSLGVPAGIRAYRDDKLTRESRIALVNDYIARTGKSRTPCEEYVFRAYTDQPGPTEDPDKFAGLLKIAATRKSPAQLRQIDDLQAKLDITPSNVESIHAQLIELGCISKRDDGTLDYSVFLHYLAGLPDYLSRRDAPIFRSKRFIEFETQLRRIYAKPAEFKWYGTST